jgi:hypothetical protein
MNNLNDTEYSNDKHLINIHYSEQFSILYVQRINISTFITYKTLAKYLV